MIQRKKIQVLEAIKAAKEFDVFPKIEDDFKEQSSTRGTGNSIASNQSQITLTNYQNNFSSFHNHIWNHSGAGSF